jgi:ABC-type multidrug transport system fused ATPase/permease subunit
VSLRARAQEVKAAGEAERGNFTPTGAPLRVYRYWHDRVNWRKRPERENFCHFWRVVAIWAPLMFLRTKTADFFNHPAVIIASLVLGLSALVFAVVAGGGAAILLFVVCALAALAYLTLGALTGTVWGLEEYNDDNERITKAVAGVTFLVSLPVFLACRLYRRYPEAVQNIALVALALLVLFIVTVMLVQLFVAVGLLVFLAILVTFVGVLAFFVFGIPAIGRMIQGRRALARAKRLKAMEDGDSKPLPAVKVSGPSRFERFVSRVFTNIADFIVLVAQVAQVKKWKICPLVEIPTDEK